MSNLFTASREHDLPPKWDGRAVRWAPWTDQPLMHICPPPKGRDVCPACGSTARRVVARGLVAHRRGTTIDQFDSYERAHKVGLIAFWRLFAHRCPDCRHDQVWDIDRDEWWDLDDLDDYGPEGSTHPEGRW